MTYKVFRRSATDWKSFSTARKYTIATGLSLQEARAMCDEFNSSRTPSQVRAGTKYEFTAE